MRSSKRVYNTASLEAWFSRLDQSWEPYFSEDELREARRIYCSGGIRELELATTDAIIHAVMGEDSAYAVVEWTSRNKPHVRYSRDNIREGRVLAAAGLYEK